MQKKMRPEDWIANQRVTVVDPNGHQRSVVIRIGKPYRLPKRGWACPIDSGISGRHADARGSDSFQVVCLAISLVLALVEDFLERGGRLLDPKDRSEWPPGEIAAIFGWGPIKVGPLAKPPA